MKQQKFEKKPGKVQTSIAEFGTTGDVRPSHASSKKPLWMPELKDTGAKRRLQRSSDEFRRKTRAQALSEKQAKDVSSSLSFSEVSIETLHSICAPSVSQQADKGLQKQQPSKSLSRSADHLSRFGIAPYGLPLTSKQYFFLTSQAHSSNGLHDKSDNKKPVTEKPSHTSSATDNLPLEDTWLEVFVEFDNGIDLVVDLDSNSFSEWFMERNSSTLLHPDAPDEAQRQCGMDSYPSDRPEGACSGSNDIEAPSTSTTPQNDKLTTLCIAADCDACSQTAQMGMLADSFPSCKLAEAIDSQESFNSEVKDQGFKFDTFERMPTFFAAGMRKPSTEESKVTCNNSNWMLLCIEA